MKTKNIWNREVKLPHIPFWPTFFAIWILVPLFGVFMSQAPCLIGLKRTTDGIYFDNLQSVKCGSTRYDLVEHYLDIGITLAIEYAVFLAFPLMCFLIAVNTYRKHIILAAVSGLVGLSMLFIFVAFTWGWLDTVKLINAVDNCSNCTFYN